MSADSEWRAAEKSAHRARRQRVRGEIRDGDASDDVRARRTLGRRAFAPLSLRLATSRRLCTIPEGASAFRRRILALEALHQQQEELEQAQHKRMAALEAEFFAESQQIYAQRQSIVSGAEEPDDALVASSQMGQVLDDSSFAQGTGDPESDAAFFARGGVPHFWAGAIRGCDPFHEATDDEGEMLPVVCDGTGRCCSTSSTCLWTRGSLSARSATSTPASTTTATSSAS